MLFTDLHNKKQQIIAAVQKYGGLEVQVFGSVARGEETPDSDVDFLVEFPSGYDIFLQRIPLQEELEAIVGRPVDLVVKRELNRHIRDAVLREAKDL